MLEEQLKMKERNNDFELELFLVSFFSSRIQPNYSLSTERHELKCALAGHRRD